MTAGSDTGCIVSMNIWRNGTKVPRSFKPDFVLIRQPIKNGNLDFTSILTGFAYCNLPTINSIQSIYQFQVSILRLLCLSHISFIFNYKH